MRSEVKHCTLSADFDLDGGKRLSPAGDARRLTCCLNGSDFGISFALTAIKNDSSHEADSERSFKHAIEISYII